jgi:hypothetical protein
MKHKAPRCLVIVFMALYLMLWETFFVVLHAGHGDLSLWLMGPFGIGTVLSFVEEIFYPSYIEYPPVPPWLPRFVYAWLMGLIIPVLCVIYLAIHNQHEYIPFPIQVMLGVFLTGVTPLCIHGSYLLLHPKFRVDAPNNRYTV